MRKTLAISKPSKASSKEEHLQLHERGPTVATSSLLTTPISGKPLDELVEHNTEWRLVLQT